MAGIFEELILVDRPEHSYSIRTGGSAVGWFNLRIYFLVFVLSCVYLLLKYPLSNACDFAGDSWSYQSTAVNLVHGHGYKSGGLESFSTYKFAKSDRFPGWLSDTELFRGFYDNPDYFFYVTPGYPFFLAAIYKIFGIQPIYAKLIQLILIGLSSAIMPFLGFFYWQRTGLWLGVVSAVVFITAFAPNPDYIMTEPLVIFALFLWALFFASWESQPTLKRSLLLGIVTGATLLVKGYVLLVFLFIVYVLFKISRLYQKFCFLGLFILGLFLVVSPWSFYASQKAHKTIILSTQLDALLLDGNNEDSVVSGTFSPGWRKWNKGDLRYLYNRLADTNLDSRQKVLLFMRTNTQYLPQLFFNKLKAAFNDTATLLCLGGMVTYYFFVVVRRRQGALYEIPHEKVPIYPILFFTVIVLNTLISFGLRRYADTFMPFFILPAVYCPVFLFKILYTKKSRRALEEEVLKISR